MSDLSRAEMLFKELGEKDAALKAQEAARIEAMRTNGVRLRWPGAAKQK
jgi:hypothetical protein